MRIARVLALSAAVGLSLGLVTAAPASAATTVTVDCTSGNTDNFNLNSGDALVFDFSSGACSSVITYLEGLYSVAGLQGLVDYVANLSGTNGSAVANDAALTVTYTAGAKAGTDSIDMLTPLRSKSRSAYRALYGGAALFMTVQRGDAGPAPWPQAIGRATKDDVCPATYGPSWAQWPNNNTGGWVCVREYFYSGSTGLWGYRQG